MTKHLHYYIICCLSQCSHFLIIYVAVTVDLPMATSFSEGDGPVQVCATLTGMTAISIDLTVSATDGKSRCHVIACMMRYGLGICGIIYLMITFPSCSYNRVSTI